MTNEVAALLGAVYGSGCAILSLSVIEGDTFAERAFIASIAATWPVSLPILIVADRLWWKYRFKKYARDAIKRAEKR